MQINLQNGLSQLIFSKSLLIPPIQVRGNIYCNGAGARNWYDGQKTDFTIANGAMQCESDGQSIILV